VSPRGCYCRAPGGPGDPTLLPLAALPFALFFWRRRLRSKN
jgi:MYXO-CTERM domain-containing protein